MNEEADNVALDSDGLETKEVSGNVSSGWLGNLAIVGIISAAITIPALFLFSMFGEYSFRAEQIGNFRFQLALLLVPLPFLLWRLNFRLWSLATAALMVWGLVSMLGVLMPGEQPAAGKQVVKIMSFNVLAVNNLSESLERQIDEFDPDIILIVEYANDWVAELAILDDEYPHQILEARWHGFGIALFSRIPFQESEIRFISEGNTDIPLLFAQFKVGEEEFKMLGAHVVSPTNLYRMELRNKQFVEIAEMIENEEMPTCVIGDFNCTPWSPYLKKFIETTGLRDSRQGFGYHGTWPTDFPFLRVPIDHAFVSPEIRVHNRFVGDHAGSDHFPLFLELSINSAEQ